MCKPLRSSVRCVWISMRSLVQCAFSSGCDDCVAVPSSFEWDSIVIVAGLPHPRNLKFKSFFAFQIFVVYTGTNYTEDACSGKNKAEHGNKCRQASTLVLENRTGAGLHGNRKNTRRARGAREACAWLNAQNLHSNPKPAIQLHATLTGHL